MLRHSVRLDWMSSTVAGQSNRSLATVIVTVIGVLSISAA
jgi:hypothetical protein